jgi:hypothetical protein
MVKGDLRLYLTTFPYNTIPLTLRNGVTVVVLAKPLKTLILSAPGGGFGADFQDRNKEEQNGLAPHLVQ